MLKFWKNMVRKKKKKDEHENNDWFMHKSEIYAWVMSEATWGPRSPPPPLSPYF